MLLTGGVGSGIVGAALASGNVAITLLANAIATGCMLYVLITTLAPVSGAHFNPAVTLAFALRGDIPPGQAMKFVIVQVIGGLLGVWVTHVMFDQEIWQISTTVNRTGPAQWSQKSLPLLGCYL